MRKTGLTKGRMRSTPPPAEIGRRTAALMACLDAKPGAVANPMNAPGIVRILDRRFWISVDLDADVPAAEIERLAGHSYELVRSSLSRKQRAELEKHAV